MPTSSRIAWIGLAFAAGCLSLQARPPAPSPAPVDRSEARHHSRHVDARLEVDGIAIPVRIDGDAFRAATRTRPGIEIRELIVKTHLDHAPDTSRLIDAIRRHRGRASASLTLPGSDDDPPRSYRVLRIAAPQRTRAASIDSVEHVSFTYQRIDTAEPPAPGHERSPQR